MRYGSQAAFRRALEDRLRNQAIETGLPLLRLRKLVAFERFLARLAEKEPDSWLLKGGFALQVRLGAMTRTTLDVDVLRLGAPESIHGDLVRAVSAIGTDWFEFHVREPAQRPEAAQNQWRFSIRALLAGRLFEAFHLDVGWGDPVVEPAERLIIPSQLGFAGIESVSMLCYPISQHLAEKVHAYPRPHSSGPTSRVKDLVDIVMISEAFSMSALVFERAILATFDARQTHSLPESLPLPPSTWTVSYARLAKEIGLLHDNLGQAYTRARILVAPVLMGQAIGLWNPETGNWETNQILCQQRHA